MSKNPLAIICFALVVMMLQACVSNNQKEAPAASGAADQSMNAASAQPRLPAKSGAKATRDPEEVVCRQFDVTGSRVLKQRVCKTRREWTHDNELAQEYMRGIERGASTQPGGEALTGQ